MIIRRSTDRGHGNYGWLDTRYTFSFANYYDPAWVGWNSLLVLNEDRIKAGTGFPMHSHAHMEIITYVISGVLEHKDSEGNTGRIHTGEFQYMTAGSGVTHSEYAIEDTHLIQIWVKPNGVHQVSYWQGTGPVIDSKLDMTIEKVVVQGEYTINNSWVHVISGHITSHNLGVGDSFGGSTIIKCAQRCELLLLRQVSPSYTKD